MKRTLSFLAFACLSAAIGGAAGVAVFQPDMWFVARKVQGLIQPEISQAKSAVAFSLMDPYSAVWADVRVGFGAYVGMKRFVVLTGPDTDRPSVRWEGHYTTSGMTRIFEDGWRRDCKEGSG